MGRELRRKQAKKEGKSLTENKIENTNQIKKFITIISILIITFLIIYILSAIFITKELKPFDNKKTNDVSSNIDNSILASSIFKQTEDQYYVYFYNFNEKDQTITDLINNKLLENKVYKVDTSSSMNANYVSDIGNKEAKNLEQLKVTANTLVKIVDDEIVEYYEKDEISDKLK